MSTLSLSSPSLFIPSLSSPSLLLPATLSLLSLSSPSTPTPTPTPTPTSPSSSTSVASSTLSSSSSLPPTSPPPSTSSTASSPSTSSAVAQQTEPSSSPTATFATAASLSAPVTSSSVVVLTLAPITPSSTATTSASSGFFSDTGAVAGTFTVAGLAGLAGVIAVALLIVRRRRSRAYEEDMEYLDKSANMSSDPPMTQVTSLDDAFTSDHGHYTASPMVLASPPAAYYPDNAYALHPQAFSADPPVSRGYPAAYTPDYAAHHIYSPEDYDIAYPPSTPCVDPNMPNPHEFAAVELDSAPVRTPQAVPPDALRPSVRPTPTVPKQWTNTRFSVDSFYTGIVTDNHPSPGQAL